MGILEQQTLTRQKIAVNLFCGQCGYNLRTRPIIARCPECGQSYDARPTQMLGILLDEDVRFPASAWGLFVLCLALGAACVGGALVTQSLWSYAPAAAFVILALAYVILAVRKTARYWRHRSLLRGLQEFDD